jgi:hypothetical protein
VLRLRFAPDSDPERVANAMRDLLVRLNRLHILEGGRGLRVEDWLVHEREPEFAGAPE